MRLNATLDPFETFMTGLAGQAVLPESDDQILPVQLGGNAGRVARFGA